MKIKLTYKDKEYVLEYNRNSCQVMESQGFVLDELDKKPTTMIPMLFRGAFLKNHRFVKPELIDEIFDDISNKDELIKTLGDMYAENVLVLFDDKEEESKNSKWEACD